ncbi:MAG: preprotein translocase subunit SecG [Actinobacteria bacterium]|nr:preprotein translocase subunit SecG [Actinomycetota bacterium]MCG2819149.1 preprotein translocase subunit SecG [Actinomycetes bacterium]MBU4179782.1 preprotein translocase subunit SecG [Actinomycetota bacterium]MBU4219018.1 preprotein translocase subunit SecG [Actinomycetota bacterium]MBU4359206.1 preprotein translocase subunit SecG [Actinomycetota bacterium]
MRAFTIVVLCVHVGVSMGLIISVLLHSGRGGGLSSALGGASPSTFSGSQIVEKNLDRITIGLGVVFAITTLLLVWQLNPT